MRRPFTFSFVLVLASACGNRHEPRRVEPAGLLAPSASAEPSASAAPPPPPSAATTTSPPPKPSKGKFASFALAATSGKVDKVGSKDGAFTPDGVKDLVFDAEVEGASVIAFIVVSTDAEGRPDGKFTADTFVGMQLPPSEAGAEIKPGVETAGLAVYENDKLVNANDGSLTPLAAGNHRVTIYVSSAQAPKKSSYEAFAVLDDRSMLVSPIVTAK